MTQKCNNNEIIGSYDNATNQITGEARWLFDGAFLVVVARWIFDVVVVKLAKKISLDFSLYKKFAFYRCVCSCEYGEFFDMAMRGKSRGVFVAEQLWPNAGKTFFFFLK